MNKRRRILLLALPLMLLALVFGAKWKQSHPTPTNFDLQERKFLKQVKTLKTYCGEREIKIPRDEFNAALGEFYLIDLSSRIEKDGLLRVLSSRPIQTQDFSFHITIKAIVDESRGEWSEFAEIKLGSPLSYTAAHKGTFGKPINGGLTIASLHPITERRLRELIAKYQPTR